MDVASNTSAPCGACKFLRRKCLTNCVFAPYFCTEEGPAKFAAIHKVFGASNVSKLLLNLPVHSRYEAAITIAYEAQARVHDPVYGCVAHIFTLQQQVAYLQAQVMQVKEQLASNHFNNGSMRTNNVDTYNHHQNNFLGNSDSSMSTNDNWYQPGCSNPISPQSSFESIDQMSDFNLAIEFENNMGELQELAFQMMRN